MSTQKFTHLLLPQCKSQPSPCPGINLKYGNLSSSVFVPLWWSFPPRPQHARQHSCCDWSFFAAFEMVPFLLWQVRVLVSSWEHRPPQESLALTRLWPQRVTSSGHSAAAAEMDLAERRGRLQNKAGEQNHRMSDSWAVVLSQVWTRLGGRLFLV